MTQSSPDFVGPLGESRTHEERAESFRRAYRSSWLWPVPDAVDNVPQRGARAFGVERKHDVHPGVDLVTSPRVPVFAVEAGEVVAVESFTGPKAGSPWWLPTQAVIVEGRDGRCVLYGEIEALVPVGRIVRRGDPLGIVRRVRKPTLLTLFGCRPDAMLHLELWETKRDVFARYTIGARALEPNDWPIGAQKPRGLLDPTPFLLKAELPE